MMLPTTHIVFAKAPQTIILISGFVKRQKPPFVSNTGDGRGKGDRLINDPSSAKLDTKY